MQNQLLNASPGPETAWQEDVRRRERALPMSADTKSCKNVQNLEQFICSEPQDVSAVCLLARAEAIYNSSSSEDEARGLHSGER